MDNRAQASLEYLILVAAVLAIAAIIAYWLKGSARTSTTGIESLENMTQNTT